MVSGIGDALSCRSVFWNRSPHSGFPAARVCISPALDHHDDLVCVCEFGVDMVVVCRRHSYRSNDHLHVRSV